MKGPLNVPPINPWPISLCPQPMNIPNRIQFIKSIMLWQHQEPFCTMPRHNIPHLVEYVGWRPRSNFAYMGINNIGLQWFDSTLHLSLVGLKFEIGATKSLMLLWSNKFDYWTIVSKKVGSEGSLFSLVCITYAWCQGM